jgi:uncharacterized membrane protein required for colicin V production
MIALVAVFFLLLLMFGFIGASRGWGKEVLVVASVILALAAISLLEDLLRLGTFIKDPLTLFWVRITILTLLVYFGYQSPKVSRIAKATERRAQIGEKILGFFMGMVSGYFVIGSYWYFASVVDYASLAKYVQPATPSVQDATVWVMSILPPVWLDEPVKVFVAVVLIFILVIVYFV